MTRAWIPVENGDVVSALRRFLKRLLETEAVEAVMVPMETTAGSVTPALVADPALLDAAAPLAPVLGLNAARVVGPVTVRQPRGRIAAVLHPCEYRALVELVKLQQASPDDLVTVVMDCPGTYTVPAYQTMRANSGVDLPGLLSGMRTGDLAPQSGYSFRDGCQMCEKPHAEGGDVRLELFSADLTVGVQVVLSDELASKLGLSSAPEDGRRAEVVGRVVQERTRTRNAWLADIHARLEKGMEGVFAACVRCHNCMTVCPICYCKTCLFKSPVFEHEPIQYMNWARRKGAYRLPADTMLFHLTRLNHMVLSCIGCGLCTDACPADLPVGRVFRAGGQQVQAVFDYVPGRSMEEPLPLITFRQDEWSQVGEER